MGLVTSSWLRTFHWGNSRRVEALMFHLTTASMAFRPLTATMWESILDVPILYKVLVPVHESFKP